MSRLETIDGSNWKEFVAGQPEDFPSRISLTMASTCAGEVPQQPPTKRAPASTHERIPAAKSAGGISYTRRLSTSLPLPALG